MRVHGGGAVAWEYDEDDVPVPTAMPLESAAPGAPSRFVPRIGAVTVDLSDSWGLDTIEFHARRHGAHVIGAAPASTGRWYGFVFHPMRQVVRRVQREIQASEASAVELGFRDAAAIPLVVADDALVPAIRPTVAGEFGEIVESPDGATVQVVSATRAVQASQRPPVRRGAQAWRPRGGRFHPGSDVAEVLEALVTDAPAWTERPRLLVLNRQGVAVDSLPLTRAIRKTPSRYLIARGVPSIHAYRSCYLPIDGDTPLAVAEAIGISREFGFPLVGAYSGTWDPGGFGHATLVMLLPPAERDRVADLLHDRMVARATAEDLPVPDLHAGRAGEMTRLPATPPTKHGRRAGAGLFVPLEQAATGGPTVVRPITAHEAAELLDIAGGVEVPTAPSLGRRRREVPIAPAPRPVGWTTGMWIAGMSLGVQRALVATEEQLRDAGYVHEDGTTSSSEAGYKVLCSMRARGAVAEDILEVLRTGEAVAAWAEAQGDDDGQRLQGLRDQVHRYDERRAGDCPAVGLVRNPVLAENCWQALPVGMPWAHRNAVAALLDVAGRVGRLDPATGELIVDLGARALALVSGASWQTLVAAVADLPWIEVATRGTADPEEGRRQSSWVLHTAVLDPEQPPVRSPLQSHIALFHRSRLVHVDGIGGFTGDVLQAVLEADTAVTREELRSRFGLTPARLSQALKPLATAGLVRADRVTVGRGTVSPVAAALALGAEDRIDEMLEAQDRAREDADQWAQRRSADPATRSRAVGRKRHSERERAEAEALLALADEEMAAADAGGAADAWAPADDPEQPVLTYLTAAGEAAACDPLPPAPPAGMPAPTPLALVPRAAVAELHTAPAERTLPEPSPFQVREVAAQLRPDRGRGLGADLDPADRDELFAWAAVQGATWWAVVGGDYPEESGNIGRQAIRRRLAGAPAREVEALVVAAARAGDSVLRPKVSVA